jgi:Ca-activated chloride channel family protein
MKRFLASLLLSALPMAAQSAQPTPLQSAAQAPTIEVNVRLVNVLTSVEDRAGAPYGGLQKEDFRLMEDGEAQKIAIFEKQSELPLSIVLAMDTSMSTRKDLPLEVASARRFTRAILRPVDAVAVFQFSTYVSQVQEFTSDAHSVEQALSHLKSGAATALYDAIYLGAEALEKRRGRKVIVLITDGGDTSSKTNYAEALRASQIAEAMIFSIIMVPIQADAGRDTGGEHALMQLSEDTGGRYFYASSTTQLDEAFRRISDELRTQYLLAYYPNRKLGSEFRRIQLELTPAARLRVGQSLRLRYRTGYYNSKIE